ncbi:hypothetical protein [Burkholderia ubonensis]|nr:hypothetical protein [Burkholderia ubonensis]
MTAEYEKGRADALTDPLPRPFVAAALADELAAMTARAMHEENKKQ